MKPKIAIVIFEGLIYLLLIFMLFTLISWELKWLAIEAGVMLLLLFMFSVIDLLDDILKAISSFQVNDILREIKSKVK